jgi:GAF domain-containing protein
MTWLELLLQDSAAEDLEAHRKDLLGAGESPEQTESEARRAFLLHAQLRDRAHRASGLAALSDMAWRLTSVRDLPELLSDIAVQARQLLRTDVTYLALVEDGALRIRYFDGTLDPAAREIRLSLEAGLAGRIVTTGRPSWTSDYLADASIQHLPQADSFALDERLRAILGVPLRARGTTLGVLFAAERTVRPFTDDENTLLSGLAGHAAVAIENARLFDELRAANDALQTSAATVQRAIVLHERLTDAAVRGGGPAEVVDALAEVLKVPVQLVDASDQPLAGPDLRSPSPAALVGPGERRTLVLPGEDASFLVLCPVVAAEDYLGCLVVRSSGSADDAELRLIERGALAIALSLVQQRALADARTVTRGELLSALVEGGDADMLGRRAASARVNLAVDHVLAVVEPEDAGARGVCADLAQRHNGLVVDRAGRTLLLVPAGADLTPLAPVATVGVSDPVRGAAALPNAYVAARRCLQAALALGRRRLVTTDAALGVYGFLLGSGEPDEAAEFVTRTVGSLLDHDRARGTDLARTLEEYLASGRQHSATAETLHIHPNTLYQRLARVGVVLGEGWREPDRALDLHVALRWHRLAARLG